MYQIYFILEWHSTCFGRSFRPSSWVQDCTAISFWQMPVAVCTVLNSWWWTERPSETCRVSKCEERENQQDATIRCLLSTSVSTCFGHHYAHLQEKKPVCYHRSTPYAVTHGLCSPEDGHNDARNMLRQKLIINIWLLHLVGFLSLHTLLTMHGHRNLKHVECHSKINKFGTLVHLVGYTTEIMWQFVD